MYNIYKKLKSKEVTEVYYVLSFLFDLSMGFTTTTYVLFLMSKGLDLFQVNMVNLVFMLSIFLFEIPTGAFADHLGRRKSIIFSSLLDAACLIVYYFSSSFATFILAEILAALASTFASGALDAWVYDALKERDDASSHIDTVFAHSEIIGNSASLIGGLAGAYIGVHALNLPFGIGALVAVFSSIIALIFVYEKHAASKTVTSVSAGLGRIVKIAHDSIQYGLKHKVVLWLIISSVVSSFAFMSLNMYWSPRMNQLAGNKVWILGWVWVLISIGMILGNYAVKISLKKKLSYYWILIINTVVLAIPIIIAASSSLFTIVLSSFLFYEIGRGMRTPVHKSYLNKHIPSEQRATVLSFDSMIGKLGSALGLLILGWIAKSHSIQASWLTSGLVLLLLIPIYQMVDKHEKSLDNLALNRDRELANAD